MIKQIKEQLQKGREKINNAVPDKFNPQISMKSLRSLALGGLALSGGMFVAENLNKRASINQDQIQSTLVAMEGSGLGEPSQLHTTLKSYKNGAPVAQISKDRAVLISSNPETSGGVDADLMERYNSNPNIDNLTTMLQSYGEQYPELKSKFDNVLIKLGKNPESNPIDPKTVAGIIGIISSILLTGGAVEGFTRTKKNRKNLNNNTIGLENGDIGKPSGGVAFTKELIQEKTGKSPEQLTLIEKYFHSTLTELKNILEVSYDQNTQKKIEYVFAFIDSISKDVNNIHNYEEVENIIRACHKLNTTLSKTEIQEMNFQQFYNYINSKKNGYVAYIPRDMFTKAQMKALAKIMPSKVPELIR
jgi:hypothetical protein